MQRISPKKYAVILHQVLAGLPEKDVPRAMQSFVKLVARHKDLSKADRIIKAFQQYADQQSGMTEVTVVTAIELDQYQQTLVVHDLKKIFGEALRVKQEIEPGMIGGAKLKYGDTIVDGSIRQRLQTLATSFTK